MAIYSLGTGTMKRIDVPENHFKNSLPIGTVCQWSGYGDYKMIIVKNCGISERFPEYGASYEMINLGTFKRSGGHNASSLRHISEKYGIGIYLTDEPCLTGEEMLDLLSKEKSQIEADNLAGIAKATEQREYKECILKE